MHSNKICMGCGRKTQLEDIALDLTAVEKVARYVSALVQTAIINKNAISK